jgi:hypothetical protein
MKLDPPDPSAFTIALPTIYGEGIIPPRLPVPPVVKGLPFKFTDEAILAGETDAFVAAVNEKLRLEDERIRRILPSLPAGYSWRGEIEHRHDIDFQSLNGEASIRIVYRLHGRGDVASELRRRVTRDDPMLGMTMSDEDRQTKIREIRARANRSPYLEFYSVDADTLRALLLAASELERGCRCYPGST